MPECRKCPYFVKERKNQLRAGRVIVGFCKLRQKHVSDASVNQPLCKDKAVISL